MVEEILKDAVSSVACETKGVTSEEVLRRMECQLKGLSGMTDEEFVSELGERDELIKKRELKDGKRK